jgi:hypothetical protein
LRNEVAALQDTIPDRVKDKILEHFVINGAVPLTHEEVRRMLGDMRDQMIDALREQRGQPNANAMVEAGSNAEGGGTIQADGFKTWVWNGMFHPVPHTFRFPKCTVKQLWDLYWVGQPFQQIAPYCCLRPSDMPTVQCKGLLSKARNMIKFLLVDEDGAPVDEMYVKRLSINRRDALFESNFIILCKDAFGEMTVEEFDRRHFGDHKFSTVYDKLTSVVNGGNRHRQRVVRQRVEN